MNQKVVVTIVVIAAILLGSGALLLANNSHKAQPSTSSQTQSSTQSTTPPASSTEKSTATNANSVTIENFVYTPVSLTVKKGTTVTWTNKDSVDHTVTADSDTSPESGVSAGPDSGNIASGKTFSYTFNTAGTFKYHCAIHPDMTGTVTVTE